jgi:hypothetical protein
MLDSETLGKKIPSRIAIGRAEKRGRGAHQIYPLAFHRMAEGESSIHQRRTWRPREIWYATPVDTSLFPTDLTPPLFSTISDDLLKALDLPNGLLGAALDVTDPEPLPDGHPLFTHPRVIVTPHLSGDAEGERDLATDVLILNVERLRDGRELVNEVDLKKGY